MDIAPWIRVLVLVACLFPASVESMVRHYKFNVSCNGTNPKFNLKIVTVLMSSGYISRLFNFHEGEWWKSDVEAVINEATKSGMAPNVSDAHTINGHPGPVSTCSSHGGYNLSVHPGKTYMLRIINAALNEELFFKIAGHQLTVVEVDATYVKPFKINTVVIAPGQTTNVLVTANRGSGKYLVAASPFMDAPIAVDNVTATATLHYSGTLASTITTLTVPPAKNATPVATNFTNALRSLNSIKYPARVPLKIDHSLFFTVGLGVNPCATWVWFMHCHLEVHTTWGLKMAFVVDNGKGPNESVLPPPPDLPKC
ncbi:hypothetical protein H0E87_017844 [Populus deltoides]|uniref:laccase n=1 Tax=Populus deltoides TaxID=3696 RepID=A0A8T2Y1V0_POPDE|nr:hypothetical protein H0E87_017844 [Populus deltoides]